MNMLSNSFELKNSGGTLKTTYCHLTRFYCAEVQADSPLFYALHLGRPEIGYTIADSTESRGILF